MLHIELFSCSWHLFKKPGLMSQESTASVKLCAQTVYFYSQRWQRVIPGSHLSIHSRYNRVICRMEETGYKNYCCSFCCVQSVLVWVVCEIRWRSTESIADSYHTHIDWCAKCVQEVLANTIPPIKNFQFSSLTIKLHVDGTVINKIHHRIPYVSFSIV